jgi:glycosyltransferase involved in cell wall biosynthesis
MTAGRAAPTLLLLGGSDRGAGGLERYCERFVTAVGGTRAVAVRWARTNTAVLSGSHRLGAATAALSRWWEVRRAIAELDPRRDAIWYQYGNGVDIVLIALVRRAFPGRLLCTAHVGEQWRHQRSSAARRAVARVLSGLDTVCVLSSRQQQLLAEAGIPRVTRIPTLLPAWINDPRPAGRGEVDDRVLFVGRVAPEKGVEDLVRAVATLRRRERRVVAEIVGAGDRGYLRHLRDLAGRLGVATEIELRGHLDERRTFDAMISHRVLAIPSYADAFSLAVLEGLAAGMRVIAYDIEGTREMIGRYGGELIPVGDVGALALAIERALSAKDDFEPSAVIRDGHRWESVAARYLEVLRLADREAPQR